MRGEVPPSHCPRSLPPRHQTAKWLVDQAMCLAGRDDDPLVSLRLKRVLTDAGVPNRESLIEHSWNAGLKRRG